MWFDTGEVEGRLGLCLHAQFYAHAIILVWRAGVNTIFRVIQKSEAQFKIIFKSLYLTGFSKAFWLKIPVFARVLWLAMFE